MKINKNLVLRQIGSEHIIIDPNGNTVNMSNVYSLNETAAFLYKKLINLDSFAEEDAIRFLLSEYEINEETVSKDLQDLFTQWKEMNLIIED